MSMPATRAPSRMAEMCGVVTSNASSAQATARMAHERLFGAASALDGVHDVECPKPLHAEHHVDVVEPEIEIAHDDAEPAFCKLYPEIGGHGRLAYPALPRSDDDVFSHFSPLPEAIRSAGNFGRAREAAKRRTHRRRCASACGRWRRR